LRSKIAITSGSSKEACEYSIPEGSIGDLVHCRCILSFA
jgi:hypothetical protein